MTTLPKFAFPPLRRMAQFTLSLPKGAAEGVDSLHREFLQDGDTKDTVSP